MKRGLKVQVSGVEETQDPAGPSEKGSSARLWVPLRSIIHAGSHSEPEDFSFQSGTGSRTYRNEIQKQNLLFLSCTVTQA